MDRGGVRHRSGPPPRGERTLRLDGERAQTTIDFLIGVTVFLIVVGFVLGIIPGLIDPFSDSQETTLVADRLATQVAEGMLGVPDRPTVLNQTCVNAFFGVTAADGGGCPVGFDESTTDLPDRLGVNDKYSINVTVKRDLDRDGSLEQLFSDGDEVSGAGGTTLAIGPPVPTAAQSVVAASRTAFLDGKDVTVVIRVW